MNDIIKAPLFVVGLMGLAVIVLLCGGFFGMSLETFVVNLLLWSCFVLLSMLSLNGNIILASTHDLKLAELLKGKYEFYHFCETIVNDKLTFDHKLHPNICKEGNAIRILGLCGYPPEFIHDAYEFAK